MASLPKHRYLLFVAIAVLGCLVDLGSKHWVFSRLGFPTARPIWLIQDVFSFETSLNEGALFGLGQGYAFLFAGLSVLAACGVVYWLFVRGGARSLCLTLALACVTAGILGNLYDRVGLPGMKWPFRTQRHAQGDAVFAVRDWIHFQYGTFDWPIFNIADSLLVCGAGLLVWQNLRAGATEEAPEPASTPA